MNPNELRIGNLIHVDNHIAKVVSISEMGIATKIVERASQSTNSGSRSPIPLTEEWLIRFGFKLDKDVYLLGLDNVLVIEFLEDYAQLATIDSGLCTGLDIEHVHQLQNLYFALTGEELKLSEQ